LRGPLRTGCLSLIPVTLLGNCSQQGVNVIGCDLRRGEGGG
jgi:hypothetical protein